MSLATQIKQIKDNVSNTYSILETKGATLPEIESLNNLPRTVATIPTATTPTRFYTLAFLEEVEEDLRKSDLYKTGTIELEILGISGTPTSLTNDWVFNPANMAERLEDVLNSSNVYVENKFTEILGETNE